MTPGLQFRRVVGWIAEEDSLIDRFWSKQNLQMGLTGRRRKEGVCFTPKDLAQSLFTPVATHFWQNWDVVWFDPTGGVGGLLLRAYQRLRHSLERRPCLNCQLREVSCESCYVERKRHILENMLIMVEVDSQMCISYKEFILTELCMVGPRMDLVHMSASLSTHVLSRDINLLDHTCLSALFGGKSVVAIMNPPFEEQLCVSVFVHIAHFLMASPMPNVIATILPSVVMAGYDLTVAGSAKVSHWGHIFEILSGQKTPDRIRLRAIVLGQERLFCPPVAIPTCTITMDVGFLQSRLTSRKGGYLVRDGLTSSFQVTSSEHDSHHAHLLPLALHPSCRWTPHTYEQIETFFFTRESSGFVRNIQKKRVEAYRGKSLSDYTMVKPTESPSLSSFFPVMYIPVEPVENLTWGYNHAPGKRRPKKDMSMMPLFLPLEPNASLLRGVGRKKIVFTMLSPSFRHAFLVDWTGERAVGPNSMVVYFESQEEGEKLSAFFGGQLFSEMIDALSPSRIYFRAEILWRLRFEHVLLPECAEQF